MLIPSLVLLVCLLIFKPLVAQEVGADMAYTVKEDGKLTVSLTTYTHCEYQNFPKVQHIMMLETMAPGEKLYVELKLLRSVPVKALNSAPCKGLLDCLMAHQYEGEATIRPVPGGYDLIWSFEPVDGNTDNTAPFQSLALSAHIEEVAIQAGNQSPKFDSPPLFKGCAGQENSTTYVLVDSLHSDSIDATFNAVSTLQPTNDVSQVAKMAPPGMPAIPLPPYEPVKYQNGFEPIAPFGEEAKIDLSQPGILKLIPTTTGRFLIGITIQEQRNGSALGTTQRIFITEII